MQCSRIHYLHYALCSQAEYNTVIILYVMIVHQTGQKAPSDRAVQSQTAQLKAVQAATCTVVQQNICNCWTCSFDCKFTAAQFKVQAVECGGVRSLCQCQEAPTDSGHTAFKNQSSLKNITARPTSLRKHLKKEEAHTDFGTGHPETTHLRWRI